MTRFVAPENLLNYVAMNISVIYFSLLEFYIMKCVTNFDVNMPRACYVYTVSTYAARYCASLRVDDFRLLKDESDAEGANKRYRFCNVWSPKLVTKQNNRRDRGKALENSYFTFVHNSW
jgi:hypothetical protein